MSGTVQNIFPFLRSKELNIEESSIQARPFSTLTIINTSARSAAFKAFVGTHSYLVMKKVQLIYFRGRVERVQKKHETDLINYISDQSLHARDRQRHILTVQHNLKLA